MVFLSRVPLHAARYAHQKLNPLLFSTLSINEYPKSGGTWVCRMLRDVTGYRFDDNAIPRPGPAIVKYHRLPLGVSPLAVIVRDPRDVFVSLFHHSNAVFEDDPFNSEIVEVTHSEVFDSAASEHERLAAFVARQLSQPIYPRFSWHAFYEHFSARGVPIFRYEDFRSNPADTLAQLLERVGVVAAADRLAEVAETHSIETILARRETEGDAGGSNFIRRGKVGGFADTLDPASIALIEAAEGTTMRKFGYL
ncbi:sulfotransferase domain-containing protein [Tsuneonella mangrovi]|uniref:sulfotransferase domain-containing protein n=1 Tax=Tsuneonella mangrovi TaxID=1982042 RepID=UPI000BA1D6C1|nr:sulfotransferase domain-containing protein [Tsuneonella mangrovi]